MNVVIEYPYDFPHLTLIRTAKLHALGFRHKFNIWRSSSLVGEHMRVLT